MFFNFSMKICFFCVFFLQIKLTLLSWYSEFPPSIMMSPFSSNGTYVQPKKKNTNVKHLYSPTTVSTTFFSDLNICKFLTTKS